MNPPAPPLGPEQPATRPLLVMERVRHLYGDVEVLRGIHLTLHAGELVALVGPSGSGKTTLMAVAGGLLRPTDGRVRVLGAGLYDNGKARSQIAREVAYVLQASCLIPFLTVQENLVVWRVVVGERTTRADRRDAARLIAEVDLTAKLRRYPAELSGGERQRVAVAQALFTRAPVILADEPTASVDRSRGRAIMRLLATYAHTTWAAVLVATHDERALDLADRVIMIEDGQLFTTSGGWNPAAFGTTRSGT